MDSCMFIENFNFDVIKEVQRGTEKGDEKGN